MATKLIQNGYSEVKRRFLSWKSEPFFEFTETLMFFPTRFVQESKCWYLISWAFNILLLLLFSYDYLSRANSEPSQTSKMECFANIVNYYRKTFDLGYLVCFWIRRIRVSWIFAETSSKKKKSKTSPCHPKCYIFAIKGNWHVNFSGCTMKTLTEKPPNIRNTRYYVKALHKKWSFPLWIFSVKVTKPAVSCGFGHIYWRNPLWKTSFFVQWSVCYSQMSAIALGFIDKRTY